MVPNRRMVAIMLAEPTRVFPMTKRTAQERISVPLSILDSTCARFAPTGSVWLFGAPRSRSSGSSGGAEESGLVARLAASLATTLDLFPQWAGQLHFAPYRAGGPHTERFNRAVLTYGGPSDPGVAWEVARLTDVSGDDDNDGATTAATNTTATTVRDVVPDRAALSSAWSADAFPQDALAPQTRLALYNLRDYEGLPAMAVRVTLFACGGYAVAVKLAHAVADAQSMTLFMHEWGVRCRSIGGAAGSVGEPGSEVVAAPSPSSPFAAPIFEPATLDARAAGDIDGPAPDPALCEKARALPMHRYSWWDVDAPGYSPLLVPTTLNSMPPPEVLASEGVVVSPSDPGPWQTWNLTRPTSRALLHVSGDEMTSIHEAAKSQVQEGSGRAATPVNISRLDALLAHLFVLINRARAPALAPDDEVYLDASLDLRRRVSPPLPETWIGSPLVLGHVAVRAGDLLQPSTTSAEAETAVGEVAVRLRQTVQRFTPQASAALLHDAAFEPSPQRLWLAGLGTRHVLVASWQRLRQYEVDFEGGNPPVYIHVIIQKSDGLVFVLDSLLPDGGVDITVILDQDHMPRLLEAWHK